MVHYLAERYLLDAMLEAQCYGWGFLLAALAFDRAIANRIVQEVKCNPHESYLLDQFEELFKVHALFDCRCILTL